VVDDSSFSGWFDTYVLLALRIGSAGLLLGPGVSKFLTYEHSVRFFTTLGLPAPKLLVPAVGAIELGAAGLLFWDRRAWLGALLAVPVMAVAAATAGPTWQNLGVFFAACVVLAGRARENRFGPRGDR
jgi:uncharacterized membrane protein YphA (DoxX/SURF4 family)